MDVRHIRTLVNEFLGHAAVLGLATLSAFLLHHYGWHFVLPAFPAGITATALLASARIALRLLAKGISSGRLEAVLVADIKRYGPQVVTDIVKQAEKG